MSNFGRNGKPIIQFKNQNGWLNFVDETLTIFETLFGKQKTKEMIQADLYMAETQMSQTTQVTMVQNTEASIQNSPVQTQTSTQLPPAERSRASKLTYTTLLKILGLIESEMTN